MSMKPQSNKLPGLVGSYIRTRREAIKLSQRALGQMFQPPVTTQFISNVERGVTPLPPAHVPTLARALGTPEAEIMKILEKEYAMKLSGRLGVEGSLPSSSEEPQSHSPEQEYLRRINDSYKKADEKTRAAFASVCETILNVPNPFKFK
jgi:transcriptional regulator with XRE-family HTH domain